MTTINQLPLATNPQPTDLYPTQTEAGATVASNPANIAEAMGLGEAAYLKAGGPNGVAVFDADGNASAFAVVPTGSMAAQSLCDIHANLNSYSVAALTSSPALLQSAANIATQVEAAFNIFNGAPFSGTYAGNTSYGLGAFSVVSPNETGAVCYENTFFGYGAGGNGQSTPSGGWFVSNTGVGYKALSSAKGATQVTAVGDQAGMQITTGNSSVLIGSHAGRCITTGTANIAVGHGAMGGTDDPSMPTSLGTATVTTGSYVIAVGTSAGQGITSGSYITLMGNYAGRFMESAGNVIGIGHQVFLNSSNINNCVVVGNYAAQNYVGAGPLTVFGHSAAYNITTGADNVLIGASSGANITTGASNVCIGDNSGLAISANNENTFLGNNAGQFSTAGGNILIGANAGSSDRSGGGSSGWNIVNDSCATVVGTHAGRSGNAPSSTALFNMTCIGYQACGDRSNAVFLGNQSVTAAYLGGDSVTGLLLATQTWVEKNYFPLTGGDIKGSIALPSGAEITVGGAALASGGNFSSFFWSGGAPAGATIKVQEVVSFGGLFQFSGTPNQDAVLWDAPPDNARMIWFTGQSSVPAGSTISAPSGGYLWMPDGPVQSIPAPCVGQYLVLFPNGNGEWLPAFGNYLEDYYGGDNFSSLRTGIFFTSNLPKNSPPSSRTTVSDALNPEFLQPVVGGGNATCPVFFNGSTWIVG